MQLLLTALIRAEEEGSVTCDQCELDTWIGGHYKCAQCDKYHLCGDCYLSVDTL